MKSYISAFLIALCVLFFANMQEARASHMMGADISYIHISKNKYKIILSFYRDCAGIAARASATINIHNTCKNYNLSLTMSPTVSNCSTKVDSTTEVSDLCPSYRLKSTCNGGTLPGVQKCTYTGTVDLGDTCKDWVFSFTDCCRNALITNIGTPGSESMYVEAHLNNTFNDSYNNSSSVFTTKPVPYICVGESYYYNQGAYDPNGDSLSYTMFTPFTTDSKTHISYNSGFSAIYPVSCTGTFDFNSKTGQMRFTPSKAQISVLAIRVDEWRKYKGKWVKVGSTERDIQLICIKCNTSVPKTTAIGKIVGGTSLDSTTIALCAGVPCSFTMAAADSDTARSITVTSNIGIVLPHATYTSHSTKKYQDSITFNWSPSGTDTGLKNIIFSFANDGCPIQGSSTVAYSIYVYPATYAGPDQFLCYGSKKGVQLKVVGGNKFVWSPSSGLSCDSCKSPVALPTVTTTYIVTSDLLSTCKNRDTVIVTVSPSLNHKAIAMDSSICKGQTTTLTALVSGGTSRFTFQWSTPTAAKISKDSIFYITPFQRTTYFLYSDNGYCPQYDTVTVNVHPKPLANFSVVKPAACPGVHMNAQYTDSIAGAYRFTWNFGGLSSLTTTGNGPLDIWSATPGTYNVQMIVTDTGFLTNCADTAYKTVTVYPQPTANFSTVDTAGCIPYTVKVSNLCTGLTSGGNSFTWSIGTCSSSDSIPSCQLTTSGVFSISLNVTNGDGCTASLTKNNVIFVAPDPIAAFDADRKPGDTIDLSIATLKFTNYSQNASIYTWRFGDGTSNVVDTAHTVSHTYTKDGYFFAHLKACDQYGCCDSTFKFYTIYNFNDFFVPSAFTPNNDVLNDHLGVLGKFVVKANLKVFNRWGQMMYEGNDYQVICDYNCGSTKGWDGTFKGSKCPQDVYIWYAECDMINGLHIKKKGDVTLLR